MAIAATDVSVFPAFAVIAKRPDVKRVDVATKQLLNSLDVIGPRKCVMRDVAQRIQKMLKFKLIARPCWICEAKITDEYCLRVNVGQACMYEQRLEAAALHCRWCTPRESAATVHRIGQ